MARLGIAFDRVRSEERMLQREAEALGCEAAMIDAKRAVLSTADDRAGAGLGDALLVRCVSHFRGLHLAWHAEFLGVPAVNRPAVAAACGNKMRMTLLLAAAGVPTPRTRFALSADSAREAAAAGPAVLKPVVGSWGRGVMRVLDADTMDAVAEAREAAGGPFDRVYYLQDEVRRPPRDIRVITVGGRAVAAMYRRSAGGLRTNVALGGDPERCELTGEIEGLAARASGAVGGGVLGVDMMEDEERGIVVHEVNNTVEFRGLASVSRENVPRAIVEFALSAARR